MYETLLIRPSQLIVKYPDDNAPAPGEWFGQLAQALPDRYVGNTYRLEFRDPVSGRKHCGNGIIDSATSFVGAGGIVQRWGSTDHEVP